MIKIFFYFTSLCLFAIVFSAYHHYVLNLEYLEVNEFSKSLSKKQIDKFIAFSDSKENLNYIVVPINIFAKVLSITIILFISCVFFEAKVKFKQLQIIVIKAEFMFLLPILYEIIYFKFVKPVHSYSDIQYFSSLSVFNLLDYKEIDTWYIFPLQTLNLFEVAYWLILSYNIGKIASSTTNLKSTTNKTFFGLRIVVIGYGSILLLWIVIHMFFVLNNS